jgi:hypothetical protein
MVRILACVCGMVVVCCTAFGQSADKVPSFEVADVHASTPSTLASLSGGVPRGGRYELRNATMVDLVRTAYDVTDDKVVGGPTWVGANRFDVIAKTPPNVTAENARLMLQSKLEKGTHPMPVIVIDHAEEKPVD